MNEDRSPVREGLARLLTARSVALVGASDKSLFSQILTASLAAYGFPGRVHLVNRRGVETHGRPTVTSCAAIGEAVDAAVLMVPANGLSEALDDVAAAGIRVATVLTSGFAELGAEGAALQDHIARKAQELDITLLGPNCLGFVNFIDTVPLMAIPPMLPVLKGSVAVVSQSGATAAAIAAFAHQQNVGLSYLISLGNEAHIELADVIDYLVDDPHTRVITVFAESIRNTGRLIDTAARALERRKPIVVLKVGTSALTAAVAQAHTGALVGDDKVFDAVCRQLGLIRVHSIEEMASVAGLLAHTGPIARPGFATVSISGGACEIVADAAEAAGVEIPQFSPGTVQKLRGVLSDLGSTHNPLDVTGAATTNPAMFRDSLAIIGEEPSIGLVGVVFDVPNDAKRKSPFVVNAMKEIARGIAESGLPGFVMNQTLRPINEVSREVIAEAELPHVIGGLRDAVQAVGKATAWSRRLAGPAYHPPVSATGTDRRPVSEREVLDYLSSCRVPVVPAGLARSAAEAVAFAREAGGPVVLKIASPDIPHKTEAGGVLLNLSGDEAVAAGYARILDNVQAAKPEARIDGVLVSPMRGRGTELFVGIARDPQWGLVLAVGLGGVWVEVLKDTALRLLPVDRAAVVGMLRELRAARLLDGYRGGPAVDLEAVADVVVAITEAALDLGPALASLEINPLLVEGTRIEALDGLAVWGDEVPAHR